VCSVRLREDLDSPMSEIEIGQQEMYEVRHEVVNLSG
jgi:hypothetical protein